jgi:hypothetical protein
LFSTSDKNRSVQKYHKIKAIQAKGSSRSNEEDKFDLDIEHPDEQLRTESVTFLDESCAASWLSPPSAPLEANRCRGDREAPKLDEVELLHKILAGSAPLFSSSTMMYSNSITLSGLISDRHLLIVLAHLDSTTSTLLHF